MEAVTYPSRRAGFIHSCWEYCWQLCYEPLWEVTLPAVCLLGQSTSRGRAIQNHKGLAPDPQKEQVWKVILGSEPRELTTTCVRILPYPFSPASFPF